MNKSSSLESTPSHARYMDFISNPKKKPTTAGVPTKKIAAAKAAAKPQAKPVEKPAPKPVEKPVEKSEKKAEAPDASSYTLGGKSPFLTSVTVEKRPLSSSVPPKKNVYEPKKAEKPAETPKEPTKIIKKKEKKSGGLLMFFIVILTIIRGALAGAAAFFLLPK